MHAISQFAGDFPAWQSGAEQRLRKTMVLAAVVILGVGAVAARSTELTLKLQLPIMGFIAVSLFAFFAGVDWEKIVSRYQ